MIYAFTEDDARTSVAEALLLEDGAAIGVQTLNEFVNVTTGKLKKPWPQVLNWLRIVERLSPPPVPLTASVHCRGLEIAQTCGYYIYDALMLAAALEASCTVFYSEDLPDGHVIDKLTIRNPFRSL